VTKAASVTDFSSGEEEDNSEDKFSSDALPTDGSTLLYVPFDEEGSVRFIKNGFVLPIPAAIPSRRSTTAALKNL